MKTGIESEDYGPYYPIIFKTYLGDAYQLDANTRRVVSENIPVFEKSPPEHLIHVFKSIKWDDPNELIIPKVISFFEVVFFFNERIIIDRYREGQYCYTSDTDDELTFMEEFTTIMVILLLNFPQSEKVMKRFFNKRENERILLEINDNDVDPTTGSDDSKIINACEMYYVYYSTIQNALERALDIRENQRIRE